MDKHTKASLIIVSQGFGLITGFIVSLKLLSLLHPLAPLIVMGIAFFIATVYIFADRSRELEKKEKEGARDE